MVIVATDGRHWRYEVYDHSDGYMVRMRDLESGDLHDSFATLFRTLPVACAYADLSAALDRFAAAELESIEDETVAVELDTHEHRFTRLSESLEDRGMDAADLHAWIKAEARSATHRLH